jgi:hypothetical protein
MCIAYCECVFVALGIHRAIAHAPYCRLCPAALYVISPHYLIKDTIFEENVLNTKCVFPCTISSHLISSHLISSHLSL